MLSSQPRRFGEALVERHVLAKDALGRTIEESAASGEDLAAVVTRMCEIGDENLAAAAAAGLGVRHVDFGTDVVEPDAVISLDVDFTRRHGVVPVSVEDDSIVVAFPHPLDNEAVSAVGEACRRRNAT